MTIILHEPILETIHAAVFPACRIIGQLQIRIIFGINDLKHFYRCKWSVSKETN